MRGEVAAAITGAMALAGAVAGAGVAWWMHRRTNLSPRNVYLAWALSVAVAAGSAGLRQPLAFAGALVLVLGVTVAAVLARRWRVGALGAGGELREFELARVMAWSPQRRLSSRERGRAAGLHRFAGAVGARAWLAGRGARVADERGRSRAGAAR